MQRIPVKGGRLKAAGYDDRERRLELEYVDGRITVFKGVPQEVWRRLLAAPNAATYVEDRIADEYPSERGSTDGGAQARARLDALFGGAAQGTPGDLTGSPPGGLTGGRSGHPSGDSSGGSGGQFA